MPTPRKYFGPCAEHAFHESSCKHCRGWAARMRRTGGEQAPRKRNPGTTGKTWRMSRTWSRRRQDRTAYWNGRLGRSWRPPAPS
jgi:hypothetical protein